MSLSANSLRLLRRAHPSLARLAAAVEAKGIPFRVICSVRSRADQQKAFDERKSKARPGESPHNYEPSAAIDVTPGWDGAIDWNDAAAFDRVGRAFFQAGFELGIPVRWGADWNMNGRTNDERFVDRPHIELHPWRSFIGKPAP